MTRNKPAILLAVCLITILTGPLTASAQFSFQDTRLKQAIQQIESQTGYRFLYRESLVSGIRVTFQADSTSWPTKLQDNLEPHKIEVRVDTQRKQVFLLPRQTSSVPVKQIHVSGRIVDAHSGEPLPLATLSWKEDGKTQGVVADANGNFETVVESWAEELTLRASYLGYTNEQITLNLEKHKSWSRFTIRLQPQAYVQREIIVSSPAFYTTVDTALTGLIRMNAFNPLGESNAVRSLQILPSVSLGMALNDGLHVRGSMADGLQVLLDGVAIYNQSHLFGLLDSFNSDALKTSGFFYDVTPAQFSAPSGGTLSLVTRSGSQNRPSAEVSLSNTAIKSTVETPIFDGRGSLMLSGRRSYMNTIDWLNNNDLIGWGLDVDREREAIDGQTMNNQLIIPKDYNARFYDLHGKIFYESPSGTDRLSLSGYMGGDHTEQAAQRYAWQTGGGATGDRLTLKPVNTLQEWGNTALSFRWDHLLGDRQLSHTNIGFSEYHTKFEKDDFIYTSQSSQAALRAFSYPFNNDSQLTDASLEHLFNLMLGPGHHLTVGGSWHYYDVSYNEYSFTRPEYHSVFESHQLNLFGQYDFRQHQSFNLSAGSRFTYYSDGAYLRWSPRVMLHLYPDAPVSFKASYSRNYQYLNRISIYGQTSADFWIPATENQRPTSIDYISGGIYYHYNPHLFLQVEAYVKDYQNLRLHEIDMKQLSQTYSEAPWYYHNSGFGQGVEVMIQYDQGPFSITPSYALSSMKIQNPTLNNGDPFYVPWDRRHRFTLTSSWRPVQGLEIYGSWMLASGAPNKLALYGNSQVERLDIYHRLDAGLNFQRRWQGLLWSLNISAYNLYDRQNPWYREYNLTLSNSGTGQGQGSAGRRLETHIVDVYDLGFQPSFEIKVRW